MIYTQIPDFDNYFIGEDLNIYSNKYGRFKKLKAIKGNNGYYSVYLRKDGKYYCKSMHRLIAEAFIPNPDNKPCVDHINGIRTDNRIDNLRWCTHKENNNFPLARKRQSEAHKGENHPMYGKHLYEETKNKISEVLKGRPRIEGAGRPPKSVVQIDKDSGVIIATYHSIHEAAKQTGVNRGDIGSCCNDKLKSAGGYIWRFQVC